MQLTVVEIWEFGGPLTGAPPETVWTLLAIALVFTALFAWVSYRTAVIRLGAISSLALTALRTAAIAVLLLCLANPVRIERTTHEPPPPPAPAAPPPIAILVDRSASMTTPDERGRTRLAGALATWSRFEQAAGKAFAPLRYYNFTSELLPAENLEAALPATAKTDQTAVYRAIEAALEKSPADRPGAIVVLTDGVDTTSDTPTRVREAAVTAGVPLYFVPGTNGTVRPDPFIRVREWWGPGIAAHNTRFNLEVSFEAYSRGARNVPFTLWVGNRRLERGTLALTPGFNLVPRSFSTLAVEAGQMDFSLRLGDGADAPVVARSSTRVVEKRATRVLLYQGALDWGFRYLREALRTDPNFEIAALLSADSQLSLVRSPTGVPQALGRLPEDSKVLEPFDCIVLAYTAPDRLSRPQQQALVEFVRRGGSLLYMSPPLNSGDQFRRSPLQEVLPLEIDDSPTASPAPAARGRRVALTDQGGAALSPFKLTETGQASAIFAQSGQQEPLLPQFSEFLPASRAKLGADVLAVHPSARDPKTGQPTILLATQTFGRGRTAFLTTDALWRWKMNERADARTVETFWQQLLLALRVEKSVDTLRFAPAPTRVGVDETILLRLGGSKSAEAPTVAAVSPEGQRMSLRTKPTPGEEMPWAVEWTPRAPGLWEIAAGAPDSFPASIFLSVTTEPTGEMARLPPALDVMRTLSADTGGAVLDRQIPASWQTAPTRTQAMEPLTAERRTLLWNRWEAIGAMLGLFGLELLLRRFLKLL